MRRAVLIVPLGLLLLAAVPVAQPVFTDVFPPDEYAARRARVLARIGDGAAILQGTTERPGEQPLRQSNQFLYLCGVVEPRAILVIDGKTKRTTLFLNPRNERREQSAFGPGLYPGPPRPRDRHRRRPFARGVQDCAPAIAKEGRAIYTTFRPEVLGSASASDAAALARNTKSDPWDGRFSREEAFQGKLKEAAPESEMRNLDPILDEMRATKSAREIAVIREATRIAGLAIMEAMRDTRPGMREYELQAACEFVFKKHGAIRSGLLRADRHRSEHLLLALSQGHSDAEGRRPGATRLRAGLQVLSVRRHARLSGEWQIHAAAAGVLHAYLGCTAR